MMNETDQVMKKSKHNLIALTIFGIILGGYFLLRDSENTPQIEIKATVAAPQTPSTITVDSKKNISQPSLPPKSVEDCPADEVKQVKSMAVKQWQAFKEDIYLQGIRYPILQLAISRIPPLLDPGLLQQIPNAEKVPVLPNILSSIPNISKEMSQQIHGTLLSEGLKGVIIKVEKGEFPAEIFSAEGASLFSRMLFFALTTKQLTLLPTKEEIIALQSYGNEITFDDYLKATTANAPVEFLETVITFGPSPVESNHQYPEIPLDIAAKNSNFKLMEFWLQQGLLHNNKLHGGNFSDTLLLQATNHQHLEKSWQFLQRWNQLPRSPETAKKLLTKTSLLITGGIKFELEKLAKEKYSRIVLNLADEQLLQQALEKITQINQSIQLRLSPLSHCIGDPKKELEKVKLSANWLNEQLSSGKKLDDIILELSEISAYKVDFFRAMRESGAYAPALLPIGSKANESYNETDIKAWGLAMTKDWKNLLDLAKQGVLNDATLLEMISGGAGNLPEEVKLTLLKKIESISIQHFRAAAKSLTISQLENMNLDLTSLNATDPAAKNLFYYAVQNNNTEMMQWLSDQQINMDPDPYGSDPMDAALRWNTHPATLATLCSFGFPMKPKHRKRFAEIQADDPIEAEEILASCPEFGN